MPTKLERSTENVGFPIGCIGVTQSNEIVLGGGGGTGRSGVRNKLVLTHELELSSEEDAPTCLATNPKGKTIISSINRSDDDIKEGLNKNCRVFTVTKKSINAGKVANTICSTSDYDYQKSITFDPSGKLVASGSTDGTLAVLQYPSLHPAFPFVDAANEINDVCFNAEGKWLSVVTNDELKILTAKTGALVQTIDNPHTSSGQPAVFRFARFGSEKGALRFNTGAKSSATKLKDALYTVLNTKTRKQAYIAVWNTRTWKRIATRPVCNSAITTFAISSDGTLLAFATASLQIGICDAHSLRVLARIQNAHGFAITALAFDNTGKHLISGSADETCQIIRIPDVWPTAFETFSTVVRDNIQTIIMIFVLLLAIALSFSLRS
ncbi:hypothetical protein IW140_006407 [Coemansia sp. RSA 1813]|nr:hypothetical protein LPJ74_006267 [Coemansia sp. RSA 1843]KAJ2085325.1 hypothetical protein IW138_006393 [Coemansia sp. RSA 986]KAJ2562504.1 hypothetical protein IW140_006407 [Coemansia sp. RSA 1813]